MNVTSFKRTVVKQLIKMHTQKGWLGWVPPQCPGLEFLLPPPERNLRFESGPQSSAPSSFLQLTIGLSRLLVPFPLLLLPLDE